MNINGTEFNSINKVLEKYKGNVVNSNFIQLALLSPEGEISSISPIFDKNGAVKYSFDNITWKDGLKSISEIINFSSAVPRIFVSWDGYQDKIFEQIYKRYNQEVVIQTQTNLLEGKSNLLV